jgi:Cu-Zn family superoxide dismutase
MDRPGQAREPLRYRLLYGIDYLRSQNDRTRHLRKKMTRITGRLACLALAFSAPAGAQETPSGPPPVRATFAIIDTAGNRIGQVTAVQEASGTLLQLFVRGLPPGRHGLHLHATPVCEPPSFQTATGHLNPTGMKHGRQNPEGPHLGDLPNLEVNAAGEARFQVRLDSITLASGPRSIGVPGTALVIHAGEDDERTDPTGNAGARIACAVVAIPEQ